MENKNDMAVELLVEVSELGMRMSEAINEYYNKLRDIMADIKMEKEKYNLSQNAISDIQRMMFLAENDKSTYLQMYNQIQRELYNICNHDWCEDYIDGLDYECRRIIYCKKCQMSKV